MEGYLPRIKRFSDIEAISEENINTVIQQLQHNIDLLYNNMLSSPQNWNVSEMLFGNMADYDSTGQKRFINGGKIDSIEKVLSFTASIGTPQLEVNDQLMVYNSTNKIQGEKWLRLDIDEGITSNIILSRQIQIPPPLRHQNILIGVKICGFINNDHTEERFDIYVNGIHCGHGNSGVILYKGQWNIKTIYGTYSLTGEERNLDIKIARSPINSSIPANYRIRMSNVFVGLNTTNISSYLFNSEGVAAPFTGSRTDINSFYDFTNNAIVPIPRFLSDSQSISGSINNPQIINISAFVPSIQDTYYVSVLGSGNKTGVSLDNQMAQEDFFAIGNFQTSKINVYFEPDVSYTNLTFNCGCYYIINCEGDFYARDLLIDNGSTVYWDQTVIENEDDEVELRFDNITVKGKSRFEVSTSSTSKKLKFYCYKSIDILENSGIDMTAAIFGMPLDQDFHTYIYDHSYFNLSISSTDYINSSSSFGFGCVMTPLYIEKYSNLNINCYNTNLSMHIAHSTNQAKASVLRNNSRVDISGFNILTTYADERVFYGYSYCTYEIDCPIQTTTDDCLTAFNLIHLEIFSSFGSLALTNEPEKILVESFIYTLDN